MDDCKDLSKEAERRKIQEDIERLQDVIGEDDFNSDEDSDNDVLLIDVNSNGPIEDEEFRQTPGAVSINSCPGSVVPETSLENDQDGEEIIINLNENVPIDPDTCLALNKAYQEVLLDTLRSIEMALIENRDKQDSLQENLDYHPRKTKSDDDTVRRTVSSYQRPFFSDSRCDVAPPNNDVLIKKSTDEQKQYIRPQYTWRKHMKNDLREAVYLDAIYQQTRSLVNRKEIYFEKLSGMSKEANGEEYDTLVEKIEDIDKEIKRIMDLEKDDVLKMADTEKVDWLKISNTVLRSLRDPTECEMYWNNTLNPGINKSEFTKDEKERLKELAANYGQRNWTALAKELGTNRTAFQCLRYFQQNLNDVFSKRQWTDEEDQLLFEVVESCKIGKTVPWTQVSYFIEGRSAVQCSQRWVQINPQIKRGRWSDEEDMKLLSAVYLYGEKDWEKIAEFVPNRSVNQCRERYRSALDPKLLPPDMWTYEEDKQLLTLSREMKKEDGKIPWAKLAERMKGRSDNMVLCRYKKLMEWKEKCEWLEKQTPKMQQELGYFDLESLGQSKSMQAKKKGKSKSPRNSEPDYNQLSRALSKLPVAEFKLDYIKQLQDKHAGNFVVPRPPIMYRYTRRNSTNVWARKKHMKMLLDTHLSRVTVTKPEERVMIPAKTAEEFKPFTNMSEKQMQRVKRMLQTKNPCEISVKDLLQVTTTDRKPSEVETAIQQAKKEQVDQDLDKKICDILQYKHCFITKWRKPSGRPRKFYIFHPGGRKPRYFTGENTIQISTVTSTLLLNALEIDVKKAMANYHELLPRQKKALKSLFELLCRCFPQSPQVISNRGTPQSSQGTSQITGTPKQASASGVQSSPLSSVVCVTPKNSNSSCVTMTQRDDTPSTATKRKNSVEGSESKRKRGRPPKHQKTSDKTETGNTADESLLGTLGRNEENLHHEKGIATSQPGRKRKSTDGKDHMSSVTTPVIVNLKSTAVKTEMSSSPPETLPSASPPKLPRLVTLGEKSSTHGPVPTAIIMNSNTLAKNPGQQIVQLSDNHMVSGNMLKPGQTLPKSSPRVIVLKQQPGAASQNKFPILPPCVTTLRGYEELLLQNNLLKSRAGDHYNPYYYFEKGRILQQRVFSIMKERNIVSKLNINDKVDRALEQAAKKVNNVLGGKNTKEDNKSSGEINPRKDVLKDIRKSPEYIKLKKRFDALFMWPAFLSLLKPDKENFFDSKVEDKKLVTFDQWIEKVKEEEGDTGEDEQTEETPMIPDIKVEDDDRERKKYTKMRGKLLVKYRQKGLERKAQISMARRFAKKMQIKSIAEKGIEKIRAERMAREEEKKQKRIEKYKHLGHRISVRLMQKKDDKLSDTEVNPIVVPRLRSLKTLQRVMDGKSLKEAKLRARRNSKQKLVTKYDNEPLMAEDIENGLSSTEKDNSSPMTPQKDNSDALTPQKMTCVSGLEIASDISSPPQIYMVPMMMSPSQTGVSPGSSIMPQVPTMVPVMMPQVSLSGIIRQQTNATSETVKTTGIVPQPNPQFLAMSVQHQRNTVSSSSVSQQVTTPATMSSVMSQIATPSMVPVALPQQVATAGVVPVMMPTPGTSNNIPQGMIQPMYFMSPTASGTPSTGAVPYPVFIMPNVSGTVPTDTNAGQLLEGNLTDVQPTPTSQVAMPISYQTQLSPVKPTSALSENSSIHCGAQSITQNTTQETGVITLKLSDSSANSESPVITTGEDNSSESPTKGIDTETSHVFLGAVPGQESSPMLISVPKDSNMTVKELIQMMGNTSRLNVSPGADNSNDK